MEQPLDFSKSTASSNLIIKTPPASVTVKKQLQRMKLKNLKENAFHLNSENSDENTSRSSASSPDSVDNDPQQLNLQSLAAGQSSLSRDTLMMLFNPQFFAHAKMNGAIPNAFNAANLVSNGLSDPQSAQFLLHQNLNNLNNSAAFAAANVVSNMINHPNVNQQLNCQLNNQISNQINNQISNQISNQLNQIGQMGDQLNQINQLKNQSKPSKSKSSNGSNFKAVSRKSMIMAKQEQEQIKSTAAPVSTKFGILSNSQNSNILQDADKECSSSGSGSPLLNTSLQMSINSNLSGEENNSLYDELCSLDDGESPNSGRRRRGQPIPDAMKDDSYWVRRRKNNEAAKKSRDAKRAKDMFTARRAVLLEQENSSLKQEISQIRNENLILKSLLGDEMFRDGEKRLIDEIISNSRKMDPEKVRRFADEFSRAHSASGSSVERMES